jgi:transcriptional regulator with XRE-family HTH domain
MRNPLDEFGNQLRQCREERGLTQKELAEYMGMSHRTILQAETHQSNPKFETVILLAKEMNISLDSIIFPDTTSPNVVPKCVYDFFKDKTDAEAQRYISICKTIDELNKTHK